MSSGRSGRLEIRALEPGDLVDVTRLEGRIYPAPWGLDAFARIHDLPGGLALVARDADGALVGYALGWVAAAEAELANLAVAPERRRERAGERLLAAFRGAAAGAGARRLHLEVRASNAAALALYHGAGLEVVGRRRDYYARPREDAVQLAVDLEPEAG